MSVRFVLFLTYYIEILVYNANSDDPDRKPFYSFCIKSFIYFNYLFILLFSVCINIRQVPREVLKSAASGLGFQHLPRDLANVNA